MGDGSRPEEQLKTLLGDAFYDNRPSNGQLKGLMESAETGLRRSIDKSGAGVADIIDDLQKTWTAKIPHDGIGDKTQKEVVAELVQKLLALYPFAEREDKTALHLVDYSAGASDAADPLLKIMTLNWVGML